jgi:hypothetical protein
MSHQDGRCATASETIFVQNTSGCASATGGDAGSADMPFCTVQPAVIALTSGKDLIVVRGTVQAANYVVQGTPGTPQITIIGQESASLAGGASSALVIDGADVFVRDLAVELSAPPGIIARNAAVLRLDHVLVNNNPGGGIDVDHSAFEISNTTVTNNGPSADLSWGGIRIDTPPAGGPGQIQYSTIEDNNAPGLSCSGAVSAAAVLITGNMTGNVGAPCLVTSCGTAGPTCGAQQ